MNVLSKYCRCAARDVVFDTDEICAAGNLPVYNHPCNCILQALLLWQKEVKRGQLRTYLTTLF